MWISFIIMIDTLLQQLHIPTWILVILIGGVLLWKFFEFIKQTKETNKSLPKLLKNLENVPQKLDNLEKDFSGFKRIGNKLTGAITEIQTFLITKQGLKCQHSLLETGASPFQPTVEGKQLLEESGLAKVLDNHKDDLEGRLRKMLPQDHTEYDVQEKAKELLLSLKDSSLLNPVKEYAYKNAMNIDIILHIGRLWLRDDFLGQHRGWHKDK